MKEKSIEQIALRARKASLEIANLSAKTKNAILEKIASLLEENTKKILSENKKDLDNAKANGLNAVMLERLTLDEKYVQKIADGVRQVAKLPDPVGKILQKIKRPNGLEIIKETTSIGVIAIIYESRPNVTIDCAVLCLKSGNATILRGGKEAFLTNQILGSIIQKALKACNVTSDAVQVIPTVDRKAIEELLKQSDLINCVIPRGGEALIRYVTENSSIPVIKHFKGVCNIFVDEFADLKMAKNIVVNAKCQRPSTCNAAENLLIHKKVAKEFLPAIAKELAKNNVSFHCDKESLKILSANKISAQLATEEDFYTEYNDYIIAVKIVSGTKDAIDFINKYSSAHSDAIITKNKNNGTEFLNCVDSSCVYLNASTRFTDGYEFGLGAEIGISTDKLHARGPMGLAELCSYKYKIYGKGQCRS